MSDQSPVVSPLPDYALRMSSVTPSAAAAAPGGCVDCGPQAAQPAAPAVAFASAGYAYAVGRLSARFPSLGAEKEYTQLAGADPDAIVHTADLQKTLAVAANRYLARQMCWVLTGPGADAFLVVPRGDDELDELLEALTDDDATIHVVVGSPVSGAATPACVAAGLPAVSPDQLLAFGRDEFLGALPQPEAAKALKGKDAEAWKQTAAGLFDHLTQRSENRGMSDTHRAMNYVALRYPQIYQLAFTEQAGGSALIGVDARPAPSAERREVEIRFVFRNTSTHVVQRYLCRVDVTDLFPFLTSSLTLTYD